MSRDVPIEGVLLDGGGTVWYSMDVLWEHYQAAFIFLGLADAKTFRCIFPQRFVTEISSLRSFNSRRNMPIALLAMYFTRTHPQKILATDDPEAFLHDLVLEAWEKCSRRAFDGLVKEMGDFLVKALYNRNDKQYPLCPGVAEAIKNINDLGLRIALVSNRQIASTQAILRSKGLAKFIDYVHAPESSNEPVTKDFTKALSAIGVSKEKTVYVGDSNLDIYSARVQKVYPIAVLTGMGTRRVLKLENPAKYIRSLNQLPELLTKWNERKWLAEYQRFIRSLE